MADELTERAVVVEHQRAPWRLGEQPADARPGRAIELTGQTRFRTRKPLEPSEERLRPAGAVEVLDAARHQREAAAALRSVERQRLDQPGGELVDVPGVDQHRAGQDVRGARELAEKQRTSLARAPAGIVRLALDELLCDEIHPVSERRDHHHVGPAVERHELGRGHRAVDVGDGRVPKPAELPVDVGDSHLDLVAHRPVLRAFEPRGHEHLEHRHAVGEIRIAFERALERIELLRDPLRVVEPLDPENELETVVALVELGLDRRRRRVAQARPEALDIDPDRVRSDPDRPLVVVDRVRAGLDPEHPEA